MPWRFRHESVYCSRARLLYSMVQYSQSIVGTGSWVRWWDPGGGGGVCLSSNSVEVWFLKFFLKKNMYIYILYRGVFFLNRLSRPSELGEDDDDQKKKKKKKKKKKIK